MTTKIIFTDEKWAYYLTNFFTDKKLCVSIMARTGTIKNTLAIHQLLTTVNFSTKNRFINWFTGGLNHQIEHHIFPNISPNKTLSGVLGSFIFSLASVFLLGLII